MGDSVAVVVPVLEELEVGWIMVVAFGGGTVVGAAVN